MIYIDPKAVMKWAESLEENPNFGRPLDESGKVSGNPDEVKMLDRYLNYTISDFEYFIKLYKAIQTSWAISDIDWGKGKIIY